MKCSTFLIPLFFCLIGCKPDSDLPETISLYANWQFKKSSDTNWHPATVPGSVHTDLYDNSMINNPFIGDNEADLQWVSETNWEYKTQFEVGREMLDKKHLQLTFKGLDTYATVFLNDQLILKTNNAFRQYTAEVKPLLKNQNTLKILFESPSKYELEAASKLPYTLPGGTRVFTRKAQFQYGWDWGPKFNTMGVWRPITLSAWNDYKIEEAYIKQVDLNNKAATLEVQLKAQTHIVQTLNYKVYVNDSLQKSFNAIPNEKGTILPFEIENPKRWWPHNLGDPYQYSVKVSAYKGNIILDSIQTKIGLRTVQLVTENDSIGTPFYFKINGVPVYAKGANYIPQNSFQNKVTAKNYEQLLSDVVDANMNMLRVWGGGIYENDVFYKTCDEKGIMVWQDFMFACAMYPGDSTFLENVQQEAEQNIKRLRNHAALVLWCGNNESSEGWHRWGWQANRSNSEKKNIWSYYKMLFDSILPNAVAKYSHTPYWETSPRFGRGNPNYLNQGDAHDWWVWHDGYPFEHFEDKVPRFMSEFGFQSMPSFQTILDINQSDTLNLESVAFENHQKHPKGFETIKTYMQRDFPVPDIPEHYVYMSQLLQAYGVVKGLEAQRRSKPKCMGSLYWQLNDCWPAVSWSSIDFKGQWKALHYKAKKAFDNVLLSAELQGDQLFLYGINDSLESIEDTLKLSLMDFNGRVIWSQESLEVLVANSSQKIAQIDLSSISFNPRESVLKVEYSGREKAVYFVSPKALQLKRNSITKNISKVDGGFKIELSSNSLQKDVFLYTATQGRFSDNFFDLFPHKTKVVTIKTDSAQLKDLRLITLNQIN